MSRKLNLVVGLAVTTTFVVALFGVTKDSDAQIFRSRYTRSCPQQVRVIQPTCATAQYYSQYQPVQIQPQWTTLSNQFSTPMVAPSAAPGINAETTFAAPVESLVQPVADQSIAQPTVTTTPSNEVVPAVIVEPVPSTQTSLPPEPVPSEDSTILEPDTTILEPDSAIEEPDTTILEADSTILEPDTAIEETDEAIEEPDANNLEPDTTPPSAEPPKSDALKNKEPTPATDKSILDNDN